MLLNIIADNQAEIESTFDYKVESISVNPELLTTNLVKLYCAHKVFKNASSEEEEFQDITTDYIYVEPQDVDIVKSTSLNQYTIIKKSSDPSKSNRWRCVNLAFESILLLTSDDFSNEKLTEFIKEKKPMFPNISVTAIFFIFIINVHMNILDNSDQVLTILENQELKGYCDIIFNLGNVKGDTRRLKLLDVADSLVKFYKEYENKIKIEKIFLKKYNTTVTMYENIECKTESIKVDTHLDITTNIISNYDIYELFNLFVPSRTIPFMHIYDFNKILSEYKVPEEWLEDISEFDPSILYFYILNEEESENNKIKPSAKNYSKCYVQEIKSVGQTFELRLTIEIERSKIRDENDRNAVIVKLLQNFNSLTQQLEIVITEKVSKGYLLYNLPKNLNFIDIPIFRHYFLLDDFISYFLSIEQQYTIERIRGGESLYFYRNYTLNSVVQPTLNYEYLYKNYDGKLSLVYDKIGKESKTRIKFPADFKTSKGSMPDVLIIRYSKLTLDEATFQIIMNKLLCYMNDTDNLQLIKSSYEKCLI